MILLKNVYMDDWRVFLPMNKTSIYHVSHNTPTSKFKPSQTKSKQSMYSTIPLITVIV